MAEKSCLNQQQEKVAKMLADPYEQRTRNEILSECNVSIKTLNKWLLDKNFVSYLNLCIEKYTDSKVNDIWKTLLAKCEKGDLSAIKLFFEMKSKQRSEIGGGDKTIVFLDDVNE